MASTVVKRINAANKDGQDGKDEINPMEFDIDQQ